MKSQGYIRYLIRLTLAFLALQLLFSNCSPIQGTMQTFSTLHSSLQQDGEASDDNDQEGNGGGYVGIRVQMPVAAAPGDRFKIIASGGQAPYQFATSSLYAEILSTSNNEALVQIKENAPLGEKIKFQIQDAGSSSIEADLSIIYLNRPTGTAMSPDGQIIYVYDEALDAILAINSSTAKRKIVASSKVGTGPALLAGEGMTINSSGTHLYLADKNQAYYGDIEYGANSIIEIEISTGNRKIISGSGVGSGPGFQSISDVAFLPNEDGFIVTDRGRLLKVNLSSGDRTLIAQSIGVDRNLDFVDLQSVVLNKAGSLAYLVDSHRETLIQIRLSDGERTLLSANQMSAGNPRGTGPSFYYPQDLILDEASGKILVLNRKGIYPILEVNLETGDRTSIVNGISNNLISSHFTIFDGRIFVTGLHGLAYFSRGSQLQNIDSLLGFSPIITSVLKGLEVKDNRIFFFNGGNMVSYDMNLSGNFQYSISQSVLFTDFVTSQNGEYVYVLESAFERILRYDMTKKETTVLSALTGANERLTNAMEMKPDFVSNKLYVVTLTSLVSVDLTTGERKLISKENVRGNGPAFQYAKSVVLNKAKTKAYVINLVGKNLMSVDLETGDRNIVSDSSHGFGPKFDYPQAVQIASDDSVAYVADDRNLSLFQVDLSNGNTTVISAKGVGDGPMFSRVHSLAIDMSGENVYIADPVLKSIFAINLKTGHRRLVVK